MLSYLTRREILKKITKYLVAIFLMSFFSIKKAMEAQILALKEEKEQLAAEKALAYAQAANEESIKIKLLEESFEIEKKEALEAAI